MGKKLQLQRKGFDCEITRLLHVQSIEKRRKTIG